MEIERLDHLVLTVKDIDRTCQFYTEVLGMERVTFGEGRQALKFGNQKINLHELDSEFEPKAIAATPGSADLCLIAKTSLEKAIQHLESWQVEIIEGPITRTGALGGITSIYIRDPDLNLIEIATYNGAVAK